MISTEECMRSAWVLHVKPPQMSIYSTTSPSSLKLRRAFFAFIRFFYGLPFVASGTEAKNGGGGGIRTHGTLRPSGFQDRRNRPLYHPSKELGRGNDWGEWDVFQGETNDRAFVRLACRVLRNNEKRGWTAGVVMAFTSWRA